MAALIPDPFVSDDEEVVHLSRRQRDIHRRMLQPFNHRTRSWSERTQRKFLRECNAVLRCLRRSERIELERFRNGWRFGFISVAERRGGGGGDDDRGIGGGGDVGDGGGRDDDGVAGGGGDVGDGGGVGGGGDVRGGDNGGGNRGGGDIGGRGIGGEGGDDDDDGGGNGGRGDVGSGGDVGGGVLGGGGGDIDNGGVGGEGEIIGGGNDEGGVGGGGGESDGDDGSIGGEGSGGGDDDDGGVVGGRDVGGGDRGGGVDVGGGGGFGGEGGVGGGGGVRGGDGDDNGGVEGVGDVGGGIDVEGSRDYRGGGRRRRRGRRGRRDRGSFVLNSEATSIEELEAEIAALEESITEVKRQLLESEEGFFSVALGTLLLRSILMELPVIKKPFVLDDLANKLKPEVAALYGINEVDVDLTVPSFQKFLTSAEEQIKNFGIKTRNGLLYLTFSGSQRTHSADVLKNLQQMRWEQNRLLRRKERLLKGSASTNAT